jgi:hypothetical protein
MLDLYDWVRVRFFPPERGPRAEDFWYCQDCRFSPAGTGGAPDDMSEVARFAAQLGKQFNPGDAMIVCNGQVCVGGTVNPDGIFVLTTPPFKDPRIGYFNAPRSHNAAGGQGNYTVQSRPSYNPALPSTSGPIRSGSVTTTWGDGIGSGSGAGGGRGLLMGDPD